MNSTAAAIDLGVDSTYRHGPKRVTSGETLETPKAIFKWYDLFADALPVPAEITRLARTYLTRDESEASGHGFVILHRCGADFYFLLVTTWRNNNELWETVFYKHGDAMSDFALFPREQDQKPTFCVWELAAVWHETKAWGRFLQTSRDEAALRLWKSDLYAGAA